LPIIGAGVLAAAIATQLTSSLQSAISQERLNISFDALSLDGSGGARIFEELRTQALRTGVEIEGMASSIQRFMALGFAEDDAMQLNRSLLDIAGSLGMSTSEAAGLGMALAQVKAKGVASMEELRQQIAEKGVPVFEVLAAKMGVTEQAIISMVSAGKIGADTVIEAFQNLEGPLARFEGGAERMGNSAGGLFARLQQEFLDLKREFSEELLPQLKPLLATAIEYVRSMKDEASAFGERMKAVLEEVRAMLGALNLHEHLAYGILKFQQGLVVALDFAARGIKSVMDAFGDTQFQTAMEKAVFIFRQGMLTAIADIFYSFKDSKLFGGSAEKIATGIKGTVNKAGADPNNPLNKPEGPGMMEIIKKNFEEQGSIIELGPWEKQAIEQYEKRIRDKKQKNREEDAAAEENAPRPAGETAPAAAAASGGGSVIAGGLANALSRISGGPNTIIMERTLNVAKKTQEAAEKTATAVEKIARNTNPRRGGQPTFG